MEDRSSRRIPFFSNFKDIPGIINPHPRLSYVEELLIEASGYKKSLELIASEIKKASDNQIIQHELTREVNVVQMAQDCADLIDKLMNVIDALDPPVRRYVAFPQDDKCTLRDTDLLLRVENILDEQICKKRELPVMSIPADHNKDFDLMLAELLNRYKYMLKEKK